MEGGGRESDCLEVLGVGDLCLVTGIGTGLGGKIQTSRPEQVAVVIPLSLMVGMHLTIRQHQARAELIS